VWIPPELREGRGELEAAAPGGGGLPKLVALEDLRGDLHCHTTTSDGSQTAEEMAVAARESGLEYLAITDHSASHGFGDHVTADRLRDRIDEIRALNERLEGIELLIGTESNILPDGSLDYPDDLLAQLDWVIASVHTSFAMPEREMTERMVAAIEHPLVDAIGHPTGRKIETRPPYALDIERVIEAAARTGTMIEINASPDRRDLNEVHARAAAQAGVRVLVDSDAHSVREFELLRYGIATARRAWLRAEDVANTRPWAEFAGLRKRAR
jgi:DNA polymerase (family X)